MTILLHNLRNIVYPKVLNQCKSLFSTLSIGSTKNFNSYISNNEWDKLQLEHVNWYPGHMASSINKIEEIINKCHIVIEVRDARIPFSSNNHMINDIIQKKKKKELSY